MSEVFFPALFPGFEPPEELAQALERLAVVHAELDRDARTIRLDAQAEKYLAEKQLQTLCRAVEKAYGLKSLELSVRYPEEELPHMDFPIWRRCSSARSRPRPPFWPGRNIRSKTTP